MTAPSTDRVAEIAKQFAAPYSNISQMLKGTIDAAIRAALADPLVTESIRAEERERAAKVCDEQHRASGKFCGDARICAAAIRAMED